MAMAQPGSSSSNRDLCLSRQAAAGNECHVGSRRSAHMYPGGDHAHMHDAVACLELPLLLNIALTRASASALTTTILVLVI